MKKLTLILMLAVLGISESHAIDWPQDFPTIEALIDLHKLIKHQEDAARDRIAVSFGEQSMVTKGADKFNDVRTTLDTKLSNGYSYVLLAACLSSTANSMYRLIQEYSEFAQLSAKYTKKKPMDAWYFAEANLAYSREIKNTKALYVTMTASGLNVMKASMDEKLMKPQVDELSRQNNIICQNISYLHKTGIGYELENAKRQKGYIDAKKQMEELVSRTAHLVGMAQSYYKLLQEMARI